MTWFFDEYILQQKQEQKVNKINCILSRLVSCVLKNKKNHKHMHAYYVSLFTYVCRD